MTEQMIVVQKAPTEQEQRVALARELKALKQNPIDRTVKGGAYTLPDGRVVDAHGKERPAAETRSASATDAADEGEDDTGEDTPAAPAPAKSAKKSTTKRGR